MLLRLSMYAMQHGDTCLRAPYMDTLQTSPYAPQYWYLDRVVGGLVGGDMLCCHPPSGILTGPLYEEPRRVPLGPCVLMLFLLIIHNNIPPLDTHFRFILGLA